VSQVKKTAKTNQSEAELRGLEENYSSTVKSDRNHQRALFGKLDTNTETGRQTRAWAQAQPCNAYQACRWIFFKNAVYRGSLCKPFSRGSILVTGSPPSCWAYARSSHSKASSGWFRKA